MNRIFQNVYDKILNLNLSSHHSRAVSTIQGRKLSIESFDRQTKSFWSGLSLLSAFSAFAVLSVVACMSIGSVTSIFSVLSINSAFSVLSVNSIFSFGCVNESFTNCYSQEYRDRKKKNQIPTTNDAKMVSGVRADSLSGASDPSKTKKSAKDLRWAATRTMNRRLPWDDGVIVTFTINY